MKPELISLGFATISAICASATLYLYRRQGKGFIWTKDTKTNLIIKPDKTIYLAVEIPLHNFGTGNLRFLSMKSKTVFLKTGKVNIFDMDMDEAYFPPGAPIISFKAPVIGGDLTDGPATIATQVRLHKMQPNDLPNDPSELQDSINNAASDLGDVLFILKINYKDGSWFGFGKKTTTISMCLRGFDLFFLSTEKRKELNKLFN